MGKRTGLALVVVLGALGALLALLGGGPPLPAAAESSSVADEAPAASRMATGAVRVADPLAAVRPRNLIPAVRKPVPLAVTTGQLRLRLYDSVSRQPIRSPIELWRIGLPEDRRWTAGDELVERVEVPEPGHVFADLLAGRYRVHARAQRVGAEDPPVFEVVGPTDVDLGVAMPRAFAVAVELIDVYGRSVDAACIGTHGHFDGGGTPTWARERRDKLADMLLVGSGGAAGFYRSTTAVTRSGPRGLALGLWRERNQEPGRAMSKQFRVRGASTVDVDLEDLEPIDDGSAVATTERRYVGVTVPDGFFDACATLPDGRNARAAWATFSVKSCAVLRELRSPGDLWRDVPIEVRVRHEGRAFETFVYRVREGPPARRTLHPADDDSRRDG